MNREDNRKRIAAKRRAVMARRIAPTRDAAIVAFLSSIFAIERIDRGTIPVDDRCQCGQCPAIVSSYDGDVRDSLVDVMSIAMPIAYNV